jgi:hypothetical protein
MLRIYRGTSAGVYDSVVNVPLMSGARVQDNGEDIAGFAWESRTPGAADTVNAGSNGGFQLLAGSEEAGSDAYGRAVALFTANTLPTTGSWRKGDRVDLQTPVNETWRVLLGYYRATNCTTAATANVLGTDWHPIYSQIGIQNTTTAALEAIGNAINTTGKTTGKMVFDTTANKPVWRWVPLRGRSGMTPPAPLPTPRYKEGLADEPLPFPFAWLSSPAISMGGDGG